MGSAIDHALRHLSDAGVQVLVLHHLRKAQTENRSSASKPRGLDEVYGSTWLTGGSGSVLLLWGEPGDLVVELSTLKPVADLVGPLTIVVNHDRGTMDVEVEADPATLLQAAGPTGVSAMELARDLGWNTGNDKAAKERARRTLDRLVKQGVADREDGSKVAAARWFWRKERAPACTSSVHPPRSSAEAARSGSDTVHAEVHGVHNGPVVHDSSAGPPLPPYGGRGRGPSVHPERAPLPDPGDELVQRAVDELDAVEIQDDGDAPR